MKQSFGWNLDHSYAQLPDLLFTKQSPTPVQAPKLVKWNENLAQFLGLSPSMRESEEAVNQCAGNQLPEGAMPLAQAYAGHQFGHFTKLGDGRAILLGEQITPDWERYDIQLKGAGRTPYSRGGDGRAALGPMLREYIISEAMHALGIETSRSLAVVTTGQAVYREKAQDGAVLTRVASSHIRVGTFQYVSRWGNLDDLKKLADYTIQRHYPQCTGEKNRYLAFLQAVIGKQAGLIAKWQLVGFIHGVMNTDNMAVSGETIDYGPCAFMNSYDPETVFSSIDLQGRYAYGNQPPIAAWNLTRFAETLLPLIDPDHNKATELAKEALSQFAGEYHGKWLDGMRKKLGLCTAEEEDEGLMISLLNWMHANRLDYTNTFLNLMREQTVTRPRIDRRNLSIGINNGWIDSRENRIDPCVNER